MKRPMVWFGLAMILGEVLGRINIWVGIIVFILLIVMCMLAGIRYRHIFTSVCLCLVPVFCLLGMWRIRSCLALEAAVRSQIEGESVTLNGMVTSVEDKGDYQVLILRTDEYLNTSLNVRCVVAEGDGPRDILPFSKLQIRGEFALFKHATNPGCFDEAVYYREKNIYFQLKQTKVVQMYRKSPEVIRMLWNLKSNMKKVIENSLPEKEAGILKAMVIGDRTDMSEDVYDLYKRQGIGHILAISALHLSIVGAGLYGLLQRLYMPIPFRQITACVTMILYLMMCGISVSGFRAAIMFIFLMTGQMIGHKREPLTALFAALLLILNWQPFSLFSYGFLMSFGCIGSLMIMKRLGGKVSGVYISIFTLPLTAWFQYEISLYTLLLNMFVVPAMSFLYPLGLIGSLIGCVWYFPGKVLLISAGTLLKVFEALCERAEMLPFAHLITGRPEVWKLLLIYGCGLAYMLGIILKTKYRKWLRLVWISLLMLLVQVPSAHSEVLFLDVGQGDCCLIRDSGGAAYLIDGGSSSVKDVGDRVISRVLKYYGITSLNGMILSHMDEDHVNGARWLLEQDYDVGTLYISKAICDTSMRETLIALAKKRRIPVYEMYKGADLKMNNMEIRCLHPDLDFITDEDNEGSLVLKVCCGACSFLLTGDIEGAGEMALLQALAEGDSVDVLKVAHHGSKYSTSEAFLNLVRPKYAVISCGLKNRYGHPHAETLERLQQYDAKVLKTCRQGAILVRTDGGKYSVFGYDKLNGGF